MFAQIDFGKPSLSQHLKQTIIPQLQPNTIDRHPAVSQSLTTILSVSLSLFSFIITRARQENQQHIDLHPFPTLSLCCSFSLVTPYLISHKQQCADSLESLPDRYPKN